MTVVNHSNAEVSASFRFAPLSSFGTVSGSFDIDAQQLKAGEEGKYDEADKVRTILTLAGSLSEDVKEMTRIGVITVGIE